MITACGLPTKNFTDELVDTAFEAYRNKADRPAILAKLTQAPGNKAPIGGLKVATKNGWFAARPSGTENIYKLYAESFKSQVHLETIIEQAQQIIKSALENK